MTDHDAAERAEPPLAELPPPDVPDPVGDVPEAGTPRRSILWHVAVVAVLALAFAGVEGFLGVGGYRQGFLLTAVPLLLIGGGGTYFALGRDTPNAGTWALVGAVVAVLLSGGVVEVSPPSRGRLVSEADGLRLPFYKVLGTETNGNSRCAPCPTVVRRYRAPVPSPDGAISAVASALLERRLITAVAGFERTSGRTLFRGQREGTSVTATITYGGNDQPEPLVTLVLRGRR